jgi:hydroxymethylpyrimidine pyrophosphatase-like HAD family hydrolase
MFNFNDELSNLFNSSTYLLLIAILFITHGGAIVVKEVLTSFHILDEKEINKNQAGQIIGFLERLFIFWFVYIDKWEGIGFLIAAKSILRFNNKDEKKETAHTEYVLVGTLVSVGYAIVLSMLYRYIKSLIL